MLPHLGSRFRDFGGCNVMVMVALCVGEAEADFELKLSWQGLGS